MSSSTGTTGYSFSGAGDYPSYGSWGRKGGKKGVGSLCSCPASYTLSSGGWVQQSGSGGSFSNQSSSSSYSENGTFATTNSDGAVHGTVEGGGSSNEEGHSSITSTFGSGSVNESSSSGHGGTHFSRSESGTRSYAITHSADRLRGNFTSDDSTDTSFQYNRSTSGSGEYVSSSTGTTGYSFSGAGDYDSYGSWGGTSGTFTAYVAYGSTTEQTTYSTPGSTNGGWDLDHTVASSSGHGNGGYTYTGSGSACMSGGGSYTPMSAAASGGFSYGYSSSDSSGSGSYSNVDNFGFTFDASYNHETHQTEEVQMVGGAWSLASSSSGSSGQNPHFFVYGQDIEYMKISNVSLDDLYDLQPGGTWRIPWWSGSQHSMSMGQQSQLSSEQSLGASFESVASVASLGSPAASESDGPSSAASASFASSAVPASPAAHRSFAPASAIDSLLASFARPSAESITSVAHQKLGTRACGTSMTSEEVDGVFGEVAERGFNTQPTRQSVAMAGSPADSDATATDVRSKNPTMAHVEIQFNGSYVSSVLDRIAKWKGEVPTGMWGQPASRATGNEMLLGSGDKRMGYSSVTVWGANSCNTVRGRTPSSGAMFLAVVGKPGKYKVTWKYHIILTSSSTGQKNVATLIVKGRNVLEDPTKPKPMAPYEGQDTITTEVEIRSGRNSVVVASYIPTLALSGDYIATATAWLGAISVEAIGK